MQSMDKNITLKLIFTIKKSPAVNKKSLVKDNFLCIFKLILIV
jgi:hypothetical protein